MRTRMWLWSGFAVALALTLFFRPTPPVGAVPEVPPAEKLPRQAKAKLDAARKTYELLWQNNKEGLRLSGELVYRWSQRWLEAERELSPAKADQVAALEAHLNRMRDLERLASERFRTRVTTLDEVSAAEFYRAEAEVWLTRARTE